MQLVSWLYETYYLSILTPKEDTWTWAKKDASRLQVIQMKFPWVLRNEEEGILKLAYQASSEVQTLHENWWN
jgi:hypothetical protein